MGKNILTFLSPAIAADAEKVQSVTQNFKISLNCDLSFYFIQAVQVRVDNFFTLDANDVWMGIRPVAVISIAPVREP